MISCIKVFDCLLLLFHSGIQLILSPVLPTCSSLSVRFDSRCVKYIRIHEDEENENVHEDIGKCKDTKEFVWSKIAADSG